MTVSYFEWVQNIENECWDRADVEARLTKKESATDAVIDTQERLERETGERVAEVVVEGGSGVGLRDGRRSRSLTLTALAVTV